VGKMRENLFRGGKGGEGRHYFLKFLGFARLSFLYTTGMDIKTLDWSDVVAVEGGPRDFGLLVNLKEQTFVYILYSYYVYFTENIVHLY
jgi:hypothetical protein